MSAACFVLPTFFLPGCAQAPPVAGSGAASPPQARAAEPGPLYSLFHRALPVPEGATEAFHLSGRGVQIFRCEMQSQGGRWIYRLPEAELGDPRTGLALRHGVNLSFESADGSRLIGEIVDHVPSVDEQSLPWVLIGTRSYGKGALTGIRFVARINTAGGMPPQHCEPESASQVLRVPFSADFVFYR